MSQQRLRIGVIGGGLVAQVEHIPNLKLRREHFDLRCVSDPSATVRAALAERFDVATFADAGEVIAQPLDAVLIAAPDPWHAELCVATIEAGLHVFCEKPICYGPAELDRIRAARDRASVVVQVGYMKRFDPSYRAAIELVQGRAGALRYVSVDVHDPDAWPFVAHHRVVAASDVAEELRAATRDRQRAQVIAALGFEPDATLFRGFTGAYCSSLVHDVNAVHGLLDAIGISVGDVAGAAVFADGKGGQGTVRLGGGQALWTMAHVETPDLASYRERISLYFENEVVELVFPSPYLNHQPTRLLHSASREHCLETREIRAGFAEPFQVELEAFRDTIQAGAAPVNTLEEAGRDQALLIALGRAARAVA